MRIFFSSRSKDGRLAALLLLCGVLLFSSARAEVIISGLEIDPHSGIDIRLTSTFKQLPQAGFATVQIYIHNTSGQAHKWSFGFTSVAYPAPIFHSSREFTVQNNTEQTFEVLVPLATNTNNSYAMNNVQIEASGYGVTRGFANLNTSSSSGRSLTDFVLMSQALSVRSWGPLEKACNDKGDELLGCEFDPNYLPTDWRGYLGMGSIWITDTEWQVTLDPVLRNAIKEWVLQGGNLMICTTGTHQVGDFGFHDEKTGYGQVRIVQWDGKELNAHEIMPYILSHSHSISTQLSDGYQTKWDLMTSVGDLKFNGGFIMIFVACFGVAVGPLNLFWFAKSGRRHRLFWTTPLISLAGSLLLALVIILQDGFGGTGNRMVLVQLIPGENEAVVAQEQISRTGLLISTRFNAEDRIFISPIVNLPPLSGIPHGIGIKTNRGNYTMDGHSYGGDWFTSRSVQAQLIEVIRPSRSRIEIIPAAGGVAPILLSSVETELQHLFYIDGDGHYWETGLTRVGEKKTLQPSTEADFDAWLTSNSREAGAHIAYLLDLAKKRRGYFYAVTDDPKGDAVPTMSSIHWKYSKTIYLGPCAMEKNVALQ